MLTQSFKKGNPTKEGGRAGAYHGEPTFPASQTPFITVPQLTVP